MAQENFANFETAFAPSFEDPKAEGTTVPKRICPSDSSTYKYVEVEVSHLPPGDPISPDPNAEPPLPFQKKLTITLPPYYGDSSWKSWEAQFLFIADANGWNEQVRAKKLVSSLKGHAAEVISDLPCDDLKCSIDFMRERFGNSHRNRFGLLPSQASKIESAKNRCKTGCSNLFTNKWCVKIYSYLPTKRKSFLILAQIIVLILFYVALYGVLGKDALPGSEVFALLLLLVSARVIGKLVSLFRLPPLIGMLIAGFLFRNLPFMHYYENVSIHWATTLRSTALVVILVKAGLGLDAGKLKKLSLVVFQLAFLPCIVETIATSVAAHYILDLPWSWAVMLGFVVAAVSPAVIVPGLLGLESKNYGVDKGIPTLVIAAASLDDILAITGFTVMLSITFSEGNVLMTIIKGILEPVGGLIAGGIIGRMFWEIPVKQYSHPTVWVYYHVLMMCFGAIGCMFISKRLHFAGAGPMGCLVMAFVAGKGWKKDRWHMESVNKIFDFIWRFAEPCLFGLIGAEVSVADIQSNFGSTILAIFIGLVFRILAASLATCGANLNWKEKLFVALAWLPKATVQAAVGPQALDFVLSIKGDAEMVERAHKILTSAVLCIIMTAPIGAALIAILGPILLSNDGDVEAPKLEEPKPGEPKPNEPKSDETKPKPKEKYVIKKEIQSIKTKKKGESSRVAQPKESKENCAKPKESEENDAKSKESEENDAKSKESEENDAKSKESVEKGENSKQSEENDAKSKESEEKSENSNESQPKDLKEKYSKSKEKNEKPEETQLTESKEIGVKSKESKKKSEKEADTSV